MNALTGHRNIVQNKDCHLDLILTEKYQLVEYAYKFVVDLWEGSNCPGIVASNVALSKVRY